MKKILFTISLLLTGIFSWACPACENQQPAMLKGITHGTGPSSNWDYVIVLVAALIVLATLYYTVKWLIRPGEKEANHIKRTVLNFN